MVFIVRKVTAVIVGAGARGYVYLRCSVKHESAFKFIAVVDPSEANRKRAAECCGIASDMLFESLDDFFKAKIDCDVVVNATMDKVHIETATAIMNHGYDQLLEKPITADKDELLEFYENYKKSGTRIFICHVLRYTPFYRSIKRHLLNNDIGKIISMNLTEYAGIVHFISSYCVGNWYSEAKCGSSFLLAKSCHDTDIMCWLNNSTAPVTIASFRDRKTFIPENAPEGYADKCTNCKHEKTCKYSTTTIWPDGGIFEKKCVYRMEDICDRQHVMVNFENGSIGSFTLVGGVAKPDRLIHIVGENGEIFGSFEDGKYTVRKYDFSKHEYTEESYSVKAEIEDAVGFHNGGDDVISIEIANFIRGDQSSISITKFEDSINGHLCVYAADESAKTGKMINLK